MKFVHALAIAMGVAAVQPASAQTALSRAVPPDAVTFAQPSAVPPGGSAVAPAHALEFRTVSMTPLASGITASAALPPPEVAAAASASAPAPAPAALRTTPRSQPSPVRQAGGDLDRDVRCLAQAVFHEARGEPLRGQRAVADVIMNRARSGRWGSGPCSVVNAPNQFSNRWSWRAPQLGVDAWDRAVGIARDAVAGAVAVSGRLMNFRAAGLGAGGSGSVRIGHHVFW